MVSIDCTYLEKTPQECHNEYTVLETKDEKLLRYRVAKDLVISVEYKKSKLEWTIEYYESYTDYAEKDSSKRLFINFNKVGDIFYIMTVKDILGLKPF